MRCLTNNIIFLFYISINSNKCASLSEYSHIYFLFFKYIGLPIYRIEPTNSSCRAVENASFMTILLLAIAPFTIELLTWIVFLSCPRSRQADDVECWWCSCLEDDSSLISAWLLDWNISPIVECKGETQQGQVNNARKTQWMEYENAFCAKPT